MGECFTRESLSEPELIIASNEKALRFHEQSVQRIDLVFRKFSYNELLNTAQFRDSTKVLNVNFNEGNHIAKFYMSLKTGSNVSLKQIMIVGILLGSGNFKDKAKLLFQLYDPEGIHKLSLDQVVQICRDIFEVAVNKLPILGDPTNAAISDYVHKLRLNRGNSESSLKNLIIGTELEVTEGQFIKAFQKDELRRFLTSNGARAFFFKTHQVVSTIVFKKTEAVRMSSFKPKKGQSPVLQGSSEVISAKS